VEILAAHALEGSEPKAGRADPHLPLSQPGETEAEVHLPPLRRGETEAEVHLPLLRRGEAEAEVHLPLLAGRWFGSRRFSLIDAALRRHGQPETDWRCLD
jgi:hypothetical protein